MPSQKIPRRRRITKPFIVTLDTSSPRVVISHQSDASNGVDPHIRLQRVVTMDGSRAAQHLPMAIDLLNRAGADIAKVTDSEGSARLRLSEDRGARVALTLACIAPVTKPSRVGLIHAGIAGMPDEEIYYWYARVSEANRQSGANNPLKALRVLLAGE